MDWDHRLLLNTLPTADQLRLAPPAPTSVADTHRDPAVVDDDAHRTSRTPGHSIPAKP